MSRVTILYPPDERGERLTDEVDEALLVKTEGRDENDDEIAEWVEYRLPDSDVIVHRSVHVTLKKMPLEAAPALQHFNVDQWAQDLIDGLVAERKRTGRPQELNGRYTPAEQAAIQRVLARTPGLGTVTEVHA